MWLLSILFIVAQTQGWECGGDRSFVEDIPHNRRHLLTRSTTLAPIRISYYYYNFDLGSTALNDYYKNTVMPAVEAFLKTSLKVYPIQEKLILSTTNCIDAVVPSEHKTVGVDADMIIYVTVNSLTGVSYVAYAGFCELQSNGLNNVIAGGITINIPNYSGSDFIDNFAVITHEITHILGFASSSYQYWKTSSGTAYAANTLTKSVTIRGATKTLIVTPNVVAKAREAFGCSTIEGVELEEYGGSGTAGSHWDKRIMMNDYMTGYVASEPIWSTITLALLQDSGWYTVDYTLAVVPTFGKVLGCNFFNNKCVTSGVSADSRVWCDTQASWTCDTFALNKAACNVASWTAALPSYYQYYSTSTTGGSDAYTDYCPYKSGYSNGNCRDTSGGTFTFTESNEVTGVKSRCFESTLIQTGWTLSAPYSACYEVVSCSSTSATVKIGSQTLVCPFTGGTFTVSGYAGTIKCPASSILCDDVPCLNMCFGHGTCSKGLCQCFSGYSGNDCSIKCSTGCSICTSSTSCSTCESQYTLSSGACTLCSSNCLSCSSSTSCSSCASGYFVNSGSCSQCSQNCLTCTGSASCTSCSTGYSVINGGCIQLCPSNCNTCSSSTTCTTCATGYNLVSGSCVAACPSNCQSCSSSTTCTTCATGYNLVSGSCVAACPSNCQSCSSSTTCTTCNSGYFVSSGSCTLCPTECSACSSSTTCTGCKTGYSLSSGKCVIICPSNCQACSSSTTCTTCNAGYFVSSGSCTLCPTGCSACSSSTTCTACKTGYSLSSGKCVITCPSNCQACSSSTTCTTCNSGYYLSSGSCAVCSTGCSACSSSTTCTTCKTGYTLSSGKCVITCPSNCQTCSSSTTCTTCNTGYYLSSGSCSLCSTGCSACSSSTTCTTCKTGYTLSSGKCIITCPSNCKSCSSSTTCLTCNTGYYLSSGKCSVCSTGCSTCTSSTACTACKSKYFLSSGTCKSCSTGCSVCSSFTSCTTCLEGYRLSSSSCIACSTNCSVCSSTACTKCKTGFTLSSGKCI